MRGRCWRRGVPGVPESGRLRGRRRRRGRRHQPAPTGPRPQLVAQTTLHGPTGQTQCQRFQQRRCAPKTINPTFSEEFASLSECENCGMNSRYLGAEEKATDSVVPCRVAPPDRPALQLFLLVAVELTSAPVPSVVTSRVLFLRKGCCRADFAVGKFACPTTTNCFS